MSHGLHGYDTDIGQIRVHPWLIGLNSHGSGVARSSLELDPNSGCADGEVVG